MRISDSFLGYIVSHISRSGVCTHVFLHLLKPLNTTPEEEEEEEKELEDDQEDDDEPRFYHLQGQSRLFPSLSQLVEYYGVGFSGNRGI